MRPEQPLRSTGTLSQMRYDVSPSDRDEVRRVVEATTFFRLDEIDIAVELVDERLARGEASGYFFVMADVNQRLAGYACYGPIGCTLGSFDLYWIAVDPAYQGKGFGGQLVHEVEQRIARAGGRHIYIETSGKPQYVPTRKFYQRCGYEVIAQLPDFYDQGDDKVVWRKVL